MKAFVAYDKRGRVTSVAVPNPEYGDRLVMTPSDGDSIVTVDTSEIVKSAGQISFATSGEPARLLQELVRTIAERYKVDPATGRLVAKDDRR
jgi:hypothetical protein